MTVIISRPSVDTSITEDRPTAAQMGVTDAAPPVDAPLPLWARHVSDVEVDAWERVTPLDPLERIIVVSSPKGLWQAVTCQTWTPGEAVTECAPLIETRFEANTDCGDAPNCVEFSEAVALAADLIALAHAVGAKPHEPASETARHEQDAR